MWQAISKWISYEIDKWYAHRYQMKFGLYDSLIDQIDKERYERERLLSKLLEVQTVKEYVPEDDDEIVPARETFIEGRPSARRSMANLMRQQFEKRQALEKDKLNTPVNNSTL